MDTIRLRNTNYPVANTSDTLIYKLQAAMSGGLTSPEHDETFAYAISKSCPTIPPAIASWKRDDFNLNLDIAEIFSFCFQLIVIIAGKRPQTPQIQQLKSQIQPLIKKLESGIITQEDVDSFTAASMLLTIGTETPATPPVAQTVDATVVVGEENQTENPYLQESRFTEQDQLEYYERKVQELKAAKQNV